MSNEELKVKNDSLCSSQWISEIEPVSSDDETDDETSKDTSNKNQPKKITIQSKDEQSSKKESLPEPPKSNSKRTREASSSDEATSSNTQTQIRSKDDQSIKKKSQPVPKNYRKRTRESSSSDDDTNDNSKPKKTTIQSNEEQSSKKESHPVRKSDSKRTREASSSSDDDTNDNNQPKKRTIRLNDEPGSQPVSKSDSKRTRVASSSDDEEQPKSKRQSVLEKKIEENPVKSDDRLSIRRAWMAYLSGETTSATTSQSNEPKSSRSEKPVPRADLKASMSDYVPKARENVARKRPFSSCEQDNNEKRRAEAEMIRVRWNVASLADPKVNLTVSNYRKRVFGDNRPPPRRELVKDLMLAHKPLEPLESTETSVGKEDQDELLKRDMQSFNERIEMINEKYDQAKIKFESESKVQYDHNYNECYNYNHNVLKQLEESRQSEIDSFKEFFESGEYKRGTFHEYKTLEIYQPSAKRRKYDDDGFRRAILPQRLIDSIHAENELYLRYYSKPN